MMVMGGGNKHKKNAGGEGNQTRICIKNCPKAWKAPADVEKFMLSSGKKDWQVTDCKLLQKSHMAFVGFRKSDMAQQAVDYFHNTYAQTTRLHVSLATTPSTHPNNKSKITHNKKRHALLENEEDRNDDDTHDKKQEFLAANNKSTSFWSNDDGITHNEDDKKKSSTAKENTKKDLQAFFKSKVTSQDDLSDDEADADDDENDESCSNRLFVRNLPFRTTEEELKEFFDAEVHIPLDDTGKNKGYAFVTFSSTDKAQDVLESMNKVDFQGRLLHILPARPPPQQQNKDDNHPGDGDDNNTNFKQKREQERKSKDNEKSWSTSHVSSDAVMTTVASRLQLSKGEVMNVKDALSSGDAAVRLAISETHLQEENAVFFQKHQIDITSNNNRSKTILLVKNLPPISNMEEEFTKFFHATSPQEFHISPSNTVAILQYATSQQAKQAIRKYAYKRFHNIPLYLEYAPIVTNNHNKSKGNDSSKMNEQSTDIRSSKEDTKSTSSLNDTASTNTVPTETKIPPATVQEELEDNSSSTIYVKNLNFQTTEMDLRQFLEEHDKGIVSIRIPTKAGPKAKSNSQQQQQQQQQQSMGYGFVECTSHGVAQKMLQYLQQKPLQGHFLQCHFSQSNSSTKTTTSSSSGTSKKQQKVLMVRNVPFQATRKELMQLFGAYGTLKQVRLPKKFQAHQHRGFAFVEFATPKEAQSAKDALAHTHLYGRHLVIEYATDNSNDEGVGSKKHKVETTVVPKNKKIRFD